MPAFAHVQFAPWEKTYDFSVGILAVSIGDNVIVKTELGLEMGRVLSFFDDKNQEHNRTIKPIIRLANQDDILQAPSQERRDEVLRLCRESAHSCGLKMKVIDCFISFTGDRYNFAFVSEGRVDFRDLVRELASLLGGNIRLTQIGTRDEARLCGLCGPCSRELCCRNVLKGFCSITADMAEAQQLSHRGSDRISGLCGRLKCCLSYEYEGYKELGDNLPPLGTKVKCGGIRGTVIEHHILKQSVSVRIPAERSDERDSIVEFPLKQLKTDTK